MNNAKFSPPSFLIPFRVLLRCPLCPESFRTHMEFMNHVGITHPLTSEQNIILRSHVYASNVLNSENASSSQLAPQQYPSSQNVALRPSNIFLLENLPSVQSAAPHHASSQNVTLRPPGYPFRPLSLGNPPSSVQRAAPPHANLQSAIWRPSMYGFGPLSLKNSLSTRFLAPHLVNLQRNNSGMILPASSSNANHSIGSGRSPPIDWGQMEGRNQIGGPNSAFVGVNEHITVSTRPLINQLDVPISANANEIINLVDEQNDIDLNLRL